MVWSKTSGSSWGAVAFTSVLVLLLGQASTGQAELFQLMDPTTAEPCILVDMNFTLVLTAVRDGKELGRDVRSSQDAGITVQGSCGDITAVINLFFPNGVNWALKFNMDASDDVSLDPLVQFVPKKVFSKITDMGTAQLMESPVRTSLGSGNNSYECPEENVSEYVPTASAVGDTNFTTTATIYYIHAQAFNIKAGNFSDAVVCGSNITTTTTAIPETTVTNNYTRPTTFPDNTTSPYNVTTTTAIPETTAIPINDTTTTEEAETTTNPLASTEKPGPNPPVVMYVVSNQNVSCIALEAAFTLIIKYPIKDKATKTAKIFVPAHAVATGNCDFSATEQELRISFFNGWFLRFIFTKAKSGIQKTPTSYAEQRPDYRLSKLTLQLIVSQDLFPGTVWRTGEVRYYARTDNHMAHVSSGNEYYKCNSDLDTDLNNDVTVESSHLKFRAFNDNKKIEFDGKPAECSQDSGDGPNHRTLIIVLCVVGAIILLAILAYVLLRVIRRRRNSYNAM